MPLANFLGEPDDRQELLLTSLQNAPFTSAKALQDFLISHLPLCSGWTKGFVSVAGIADPLPVWSRDTSVWLKQQYGDTSRGDGFMLEGEAHGVGDDAPCEQANQTQASARCGRPCVEVHKCARYARQYASMCM